MPRKIVKGGTAMPRIRENSRLMHTHESMVDYLSGRAPSGNFLNDIRPGFFGLNFLNPLEEDIVYSDDDDDDDDRYYQRRAANRTLEPHPQIKQLTDEEADRIAKELIEEEERRKEKTKKNKRKKMRKKEKKRLEKESAVKDGSAEEEQGKSDSSEKEDDETIIESNAETTGSSRSDKTQKATEAARCDKTGADTAEKNLVKMNENEEEEQKDLDFNNSYAASAESAPEETWIQKQKKGGKKAESKLSAVQQPEVENPNITEEPEVRKKEKAETSKEKSMDPILEEYAKKSIEFANMGNRLAASGQYEKAVKCFTEAIKFNPKEFKLFGNRSLCFERLQQYESALTDADVALSMEPNWIKGLFRKGKALCGLKRYYEASLIYKEVLRLESTSAEAAQELKRAQTLHLMEMGFSWAVSSEALKTHGTLEEAVEALFASESNTGPGVCTAPATSKETADPPAGLKDDDGDDDDDDDNDDDVGEWTVLQPSRPRMQQMRESDAFGQNRSKSQSPTPRSRNGPKPELFPVWTGLLAPTVTYVKLHELFSRAGAIYSIKMLLEQQCAFVNYTRKEDCDKAIQCINGMIFEGAPLTVRYPYKVHPELGGSKLAATDRCPRPSTYKKECFFWRTTGCTRDDCTFRHVPEHKNIDREKFTSRLGLHAAIQK
ncbi:RNA polymerase II-associated protein 3-like [Pundamilia nyererei]|uniref:RNA polymerase II-associated protein 3-like n=1 Tax=Pundamilia nyererei TaxID=303518 RepID=A0A3B4GRN1_9CICH|nr:PREDICTED: RNA polymerase II-associated protein 3-like [Pundamilia nyererei]